ncbi:MAG: TraB domain-containing protein [Candidatus Aenigmatarchaeota archaeon]
MASIRIIGTSHISPQSARKVKEIIRKEKPDCVTVELCPERFWALRRGYERPKLSAGLTHYLLGIIQQHLGNMTGVLPGTEMMKAAEAGQEVGAKVVLIDKDIHEIMDGIARVSAWEKFRLFGKLFVSLLVAPFSHGAKIDLRKVPPERVVDQAMEEMKRDMPGFYRVLVTDRNEYMAGWIKRLGKDYNKIIVVVGAGHKKGLKRLLGMKNVKD